MKTMGAGAGRILFSAAAAVLSALLAGLTGCRIPDPVDDKLLRVVEDAIPPDITLASPADNGEIRSTVVVAGRISDSSFKADDKDGVLDNIVIQVQAEPQLTRTVKLAGSAFTVTPADPTFTFDFSTGDFSIELNTSSIDRSREFIVTATDRNGNIAEVRRLLFPSDGMLVQLDEPGGSFTKFEVGGLFTIEGRVANSSTDASIDELGSLKWEIVQNPTWSAFLNLTPGTTWNDGGTQRLYELADRYTAKINAPFPDIMPQFELLKADGSFTSSFTIPPSGVTTLTVRVTATDKNGVARSAERTVTEDLAYATFIMIPPDPKYGSPEYSYYSSSPPAETITVCGMVDDVSLVAQLKYDLSSTVGAPVSRTYTSASVPPLSSVMDSATGLLTFTVDTTGRQGNIILTITAKSTAGLEAPFPTTIRDDCTAPSITGASIRSNNAQSAASGGKYAKVGDTVTLDFTLSDAQTGVDTAATAVTIGGGAATVAPVTGGWRATRVLMGGEPQALPFTVTAKDSIGNTRVVSATTDGTSVTFYEGAPAISGLTMTSSNPSSAWAKESDVVTLSFASTRELASAPTVQVAGRAATVAWTKPSCTATAAMQAADPQGAVPFSIALTDAAGNATTITQAAMTPTPNVTFDSIAPASPTGLDLDAGDDSGSSSSDDITYDSSWLIRGLGEEGAVIRIRLDGTQVATTPAAPAVAGGVWSAGITVGADGDRKVKAFAVDPAGNASGDSAELTVKRDTAPPPTPAALDLSAGDDSGNNGDNITNDSSWLISGSCVTSDAAVIRIQLDGAAAVTTPADPIVAANAWSAGINVGTDGIHKVRALAVDTAGNQSVASSELSVTRDTQISAPSTPDLAAAGDSGTFSTDNITKNTTLTFTGTADAGDTVDIIVGGASRGSGTATGGNYSIAVNLSAAAGFGDGTWSITARASDVAGNTPAESTALDVTIDTALPPVPAALDLFSGDDSGNNSDNITNDSSWLISGTDTEDGAVIRLRLDGTPIATTPADPVVAGGAWSATINVAADGDRKVRALAVDTAGNQSTLSSELTVKRDTALPPVPAALDLSAGDDSGNNSDNITNDSSWLISGTDTEDGAVIRILLDGAQVTTTPAVPVVAGGAWSATIDVATDGVHKVRALAVDAADNSSTASLPELSVTRDTQINAPSTPDLATASDTGASSSDDRTKNTTLTFTGTADAGDTVEILVGGASRASGTATGGNYSIAVNLSAGAGFGDGTWSITARASDVAGNTPLESTALDVTIDTTAPTVTAFVPSDAELLETESGTLTLDFTYSEPMDTAVDPTITFDRNVSARLSDPPSCSWAGNTVTATYTVTAAGTDPADAIIVTAAGARDVAGNTQATFASAAGAFKVSRSMTGSGATPPRSAAPRAVASGRPVPAPRVRGSGRPGPTAAAPQTAHTMREAAAAPATGAAEAPRPPQAAPPLALPALPQPAQVPAVKDARSSVPVAAAPAPATAAEQADPAAPIAAAPAAHALAPAAPGAELDARPQHQSAFAELTVLCAAAAAAALTGHVLRRRRGRR